MTITQPTSNGLLCSTCHNDFDAWTRREAGPVLDVLAGRGLGLIEIGADDLEEVVSGPIDRPLADEATQHLVVDRQALAVALAAAAGWLVSRRISQPLLALSGVTANATVVVGDAGDSDDSTYTVTVNTIAGDGTLGLDIAAGNNITDTTSNALDPTPTVDEVYTIDNMAPRVAITRDSASATWPPPMMVSVSGTS